MQAEKEVSLTLVVVPRSELEVTVVSKYVVEIVSISEVPFDWSLDRCVELNVTGASDNDVVFVTTDDVRADDDFSSVLYNDVVSVVTATPELI